MKFYFENLSAMDYFYQVVWLCFLWENWPFAFQAFASFGEVVYIFTHILNVFFLYKTYKVLTTNYLFHIFIHTRIDCERF